ncbi:MAG: NifB/NifX family molybdenum-iron cluster-binding protein [Candidatus Omnitrophica bacterium]|nr:NifB/NifX family molybdenum-iron cluster-binding protein [Candidatus Omnitrophota bacterium]
MNNLEILKPNHTLKIAIPLSGGLLSEHFGHCDQFALVEANPDTKTILNTVLVTPPPHEPGLLPRWLQQQGVQLIIAGGMGQRALNLFAQNGITVRSGRPGGAAEECVADYLDGALTSTAQACNQHEHGCH